MNPVLEAMAPPQPTVDSRRYGLFFRIPFENETTMRQIRAKVASDPW